MLLDFMSAVANLLLLLVLNREPRLVVFPAKPQRRGSRGSVPRRTSTVSFGWQRFPPDLDRESEDMLDRTPEKLSERMSEDY